MQPNPTAAIGSNLAEPINQSVTAANGAQFALLLSFMFEAQAASTLVHTPAPATAHALSGDSPPQRREFRLELGLENALAGNNEAHINLLRSLLLERTEQLLAKLTPQMDLHHEMRTPHPQRRNEDLIEEIQKARKMGLRNPGVEQERISLRTGMAAL